jgi:hypothetical protein
MVTSRQAAPDPAVETAAGLADDAGAAVSARLQAEIAKSAATTPIERIFMDGLLRPNGLVQGSGQPLS